MKINRVAFVEPMPDTITVFDRAGMIRGSALLATIVSKAGYKAKAYRKKITDEFLDKITWEADIVGISTLTNTYLLGCEAADILRKAGKIVIMGGPHVTFETEDALKHCDFVFRGEADDTIVPFLKALERGSGLEKINGLSFLEDGMVVNCGPQVLCKNIDSLPPIDWSLVEEDGKSDIRPVMTSRGCPFNCTFCSVTAMFGKKFRHRSSEKVLEEIPEDGFAFYIDDNLAGNYKRLEDDLLPSIIASGKTPFAACQVRAEIAKRPRLLELKRKANIRIDCIGFESVNPATLKEFEKGQTVEGMKENIKILHKYGDLIHGMFVLGADNDTVETIRETLKFAIDNELESVQFMILTPLPGTQQYRDFEKEGRIVSKDWRLYAAHHAVFKPKNMSMYVLQKEAIGAMYEFYSPWRTIRRFVSKVIKNPKSWRDELWVAGIRFYARNQIINWYEDKKNQKFLKSLKGRG